MNLSKAEKLLPLWTKLDKHFRSRLEELREANDASMPDADRNQYVGKIAFCKEVLALSEEDHKQAAQ